jgi:hypothetical protein
MVMGDLVLTDREIAPVMTRLTEGGIEITALHGPKAGPTPITIDGISPAPISRLLSA